jgi:uncharacterized protein
MAVSKFAGRYPVKLSGAAVLMAALLIASQVHAQRPESPAESRITVIGVGSVHVVPDQARIRGGVTTRAKTVKEASDANSKLMSAITAMLLASGIAQTDIQTARFSVQPVYAPAQPGVEPKLAGYAVANHVEVTIREISKVGDILDRLVNAGATDIGNIEFLHSDASKVLDQAREAAVADGRHKAELYARAAGVSLGRVLSIREDAAPGAPVPFARASALREASVPIASGEDTLEARITVAYEVVR